MKSHFQNSESIYGVNCWWWWLNGNVNKAAITKDLEAMKSRNFQGAMIFDAGGHNQRGNKDIPKGPLFESDEWNELFLFALDEAKRRGLEIGFNIQSGWNLGDPRVTPEYTAKQITYSEIKIAGGKKVTKKLRIPRKRRGFYSDIVVLAFPVRKENETNELITDLNLKLGFRISGKQPELWDALTGEIRHALAFSHNDGMTTVPLTLEPYGALVVVFNDEIPESKQGKGKRNYPDYKTILEIAGPREVHFDTKWGGPASVTFPELIDWTKHTNEGVKYYSGTAVCHKTFNLEAELEKANQYFLQLGSVLDVGIAEVKINGVDKGVVWTSPFRVEISEEIQNGENNLEVKVVNSWYNRVAGDQTFPDKKQYTFTNIELNHDFMGRTIDLIPLEPSGLLGPVTIEGI